jgi:hypothetical protein
VRFVGRSFGGRRAGENRASDEEAGSGANESGDIHERRKKPKRIQHATTNLGKTNFLLTT